MNVRIVMSLSAHDSAELRHNIPDFRPLPKFADTASRTARDEWRAHPAAVRTGTSPALLARDAGFDRRLGDRSRHRRHDTRVEHRRRDVLLAELALGHDRRERVRR